MNKIKKVIGLSLFLVVGVFGVVDGVVQSAALLALDGLARDEIAHVDHVAQFAEVGGGFDALEEFFGLLVEQVQTRPGAFQAQIAAHNAHVARHDLPHLFGVLGDEDFLFIGECALVVPFGHAVVEGIFVQVCERVACGCLGIDHGFEQGVGCQAVATVQPCARAFAHGIKALDA